MKKISLCLIVKDEEKVLERCIKSLEGAYDELIIVDTGSTDSTIAIAKSLGARVEIWDKPLLHITDINGQKHTCISDFAAARNYSFSFASHPWVMWVDADDILMAGDAHIFRQIVSQYDNDDNIIGINFPYIYSHESNGTGEIPNFKYHRLRIVKKGYGCWKGRIHEFIEHDETKTIDIDQIAFHHYRDRGKGTQNTARNLAILKEVVADCNPDEKPRYLFYLAKELTYNGKIGEAIDVFQQYIPVSNWIPEKHRAMYELAVCYQILGDISNARKYALQAIHLNEDYVDPYVLLGIIAYNQERWNDVIKWMNAALSCNAPKTLFFDYIPYTTYVPHDYLHIAYWNTGKKDKAIESVKICLKYKPHDTRYQHNLSFFTDKLIPASN